MLNAVLRTRDVAPNNTNLGIVLLLAPWAKRQLEEHLRSDLPDASAAADATDADIIYHAIRLARPGSLGAAPDQDIRQTPTKSLREVMALAAERDLIARQYANGFQEVLQDGVPALQHGLAEIGTLEGAIIACHLHLLSFIPTASLPANAAMTWPKKPAAGRARSSPPVGLTAAGLSAIDDFDAWLLADGHRRNPGTTADLVAASLFAAWREGIISLPVQVPWSAQPNEVRPMP